MARYVDADKGIKDVLSWGETRRKDMPYAVALAEFACGVIYAIPTADVVEVVRCKDCKFESGIGCPFNEAVHKRENDFCSYGKRKE